MNHQAKRDIVTSPSFLGVAVTDTENDAKKDEERVVANLILK